MPAFKRYIAWWKGNFEIIFTKSCINSEINIGNDIEQITILALAEKVIALSGKDIKPEKISFSESDRQEKREVFDRIPSIEKAKRLLGYTPQISIDEGITELLRSENNSSDWSDYRAVKAT